MKIWETLVGVRDDLPSLRQKWWHRLAIIFVFVAAALLFLISAAVMNAGQIAPTPQNIFSLSIVTFAKGRPGHVTHLTELSEHLGSVGTLQDDKLAPLQLAPPPEDIRCEAPPRYKARQKFVEKDVKTGAEVVFTTIPDYTGQDDREARHCAASPAYASLVGQQVISYRVNSYYRRWRAGGIAARCLGISTAWVILALNVYYRGIVSIYAMRRKRRIRKPSQNR